ncbi:MAG: hypothetical protein Rubg2KO_40620 [Rubricoccaceae bacterium]
MLDVLTSIGASSIPILWVPLLVWTVLWALAEGLLWALRNAHPGIRYRLTQSVLWALPLSLALAAWIPSDWLPSSWALNSWTPVSASDPVEGVIHIQPLIDAVELATPASPVGPNLVLVGLGLGVLVGTGIALVSLVRLGAQSVAVLQLRRALPRVEDPTFDASAHRIASSLGMNDAADVVLTSADVVPMTLGIRRPLVVIPHTLPPTDRRAALLHELVHVRARDPLAQATEALVTALFSAHPAAHRLARQCDLLREMACDAAVLAHTHVSRRSYAALVSSFVTPSTTRALPATVGMASPVVHIHQRLRAMSMSRPLPSRLATWLPAFAILLIATVLVTAGSALAQTPVEEVEVIVEEPAGTLRLVTEDSVRIRALREEIEALSAQPNSNIRGEVIEEREIPISELREIEASTIRGGVLRERLNSLRDSERQLEDDASRVRDLQEELERVAYENRFLRRAGADSVVAVGQIRQMSETEVRLRAMKEELEAVRARSKVRPRAGEIVEARPESPLLAVETEGIALGEAYPNPARDEISIEVTVSASSDVTVGLYDTTGRRVATRTLRLEPGAHNVEIGTSELAAGTYVYSVSAQSGSQTAESSRQITIVR